MINLPIEIGDVILAGRFKNKKITVKEITFDEYGLPLVNGRGIMKIRIQKLMPTKPSITESQTSTNDPKIQRLVDSINTLIKSAKDSDGDPIEVVDSSSTWEEPMVYEPIIYSNGALKITYTEPRRGSKKSVDVIKKSNMEFDGIPILKSILKMYKKAIKSNNSGSIKEMVQRIIKEADLTDRPELEKEARRYAELANKMKELEAQLEEMSAEYEGLDNKFRTELEAIGKAKDTFIRAGKILIKIERAQYKRDNKSYKTGWDYLYPRVQGSMKKIADDAMKMVETTSTVKSKIAVVNTENRLVESKFTDLIKKFGGWLKSQTSKLLGLTSQANLELDKLEKLV